MSRNRREHGRIISVETKTRGDALAEDVAAGATSITVEDAGDFDEDGGWLTIGGQVVEFTECDDDTGVILLADPLTAAAEQGDPVQVWSDLYEEVIDYQVALVELDGEYDNPDPVVAEVAEGVGELPEGDRGRAGESCTLHRVGEDEWEVVGVGGRSRKSSNLRAEADDFHVLTSAEVAAGSATVELSHRPDDEWLIAFLAGVPQRPTNYSINYDAQTITWPLDGWEKADDVIWVHYAYRKGVKTATVTEPVASYHDAILARGPEVFLELDETTGNPVDIAGGHGANHYNVALAQPSLLADGSGYSVGYNGANAYTDIPVIIDINAPTLAVVVRAKMASVSGTQVIASRLGSAGSRSFLLSVEAGRLRAQVVIGGNESLPVALGSTPIVAGRTYTFGFSFDGSTLSAYVDGLLDGSVALSGSVDATTAPLELGRAAGAVYGAVTLDGFAYFTHPLTADDMLAIHQGALLT